MLGEERWGEFEMGGGYNIDDDAKVLIYKDEIHIWKDGKHYMGNVG